MTEAATETSPAAETATTATTGTETTTAEQATTTEAQQTTDSPWSDPAKAEAEITRLRNENAASRTNAKAQAAEEARNELLTTLTKALGGDAGEQPVTIEELTKQLTDQTGETTKTRSELRDTRAELVVWRNHADLKVDAQALTDSRAFASAIADLDPSDATFEQAVKDAAQEAAKQNPRLAAAQVAGRSGADLTGGSGEGAVTAEQFKQMSGSERNKLAQTNPTLYSQLSSQL